MAFAFNCSVLGGVKCDWEGVGETKEDLLAKVREHSKDTHPVNEMVVRQSMRNVGSA